MQKAIPQKDGFPPDRPKEHPLFYQWLPPKSIYKLKIKYLETRSKVSKDPTKDFIL